MSNVYALELGIVQEIRGSAKLVRDDLKRPFELLEGESIKLNDIIKVGKRSLVKIVYSDKTKVIIGANSELRLERMKQAKTKVINLFRGQIRSQVKKNKNRKIKMIVKTREVALGVRGTDFQIKEGNVYVKKGEVVVNDIDDYIKNGFKNSVKVASGEVFYERKKFKVNGEIKEITIPREGPPKRYKKKKKLRRMERLILNGKENVKGLIENSW